MKVVILAGGRGSRLSEETTVRPKPLVEIGEKPIIWHIMSIYSHFGLNDFIVCAGYKGYQLKEYFVNLVMHHSDVTVDLANNTVQYHHSKRPEWRVSVIDTGIDSQTGGRLKRIQRHLDANEPFCMTYGDGVGDVDVAAELEFHRAHGLMATMCAVKQPGRFGSAIIDGDRVAAFVEKPTVHDQRVNGGFFVLNPGVFDLLKGDETVWEDEPLERLAQQGQLGAYAHDGFWKPMDTLREKLQLEEMWNSGRAPWKVWS